MNIEKYKNGTKISVDTVQESEYEDNWGSYDYEKGANFVDIVSFFNRDFSEITVDEFIKSFCEEVGFKDEV